jgi:hypothetical protein
MVIAKLDRLSRNAAFLLALRDSGVRFEAVDRPEVPRSGIDPRTKAEEALAEMSTSWDGVFVEMPSRAPLHQAHLFPPGSA